MDSPPRPAVQWVTPSTPTKRVRARPRSLNKTAKSHNCKRCLFGRPEREEVNQWLDSEMEKLKLEQQRRWNFDFTTMTPLPDGDWEWEKLDSSENHPAVLSSGPPPPPATPLATLQPSVEGRDSSTVRRLSINEEDDVAADEDFGEDDVFDEPDIGQLAKRMKLSSDAIDENTNPILSASLVPTSPIIRFGSPLFGRGSLTRSLSESSDASTDGISASAPPVGATSLSNSPINPPATSATSTSVLSPSQSLFVPPSTPCRSTSVNLPSPPHRSRNRLNFSTSDSTKPGNASQKRLHDYFPVKRRCQELSGAPIATKSFLSVRSRKRINFE